ncbi:mitochondrial import receptor subunit TOM20 homolog B-like isoform X2 [Mya arenaria]|uniref:mitochondrial import receptor subunit TOM20 homolog B-like isoform X2 n=1 Tax=Mya arenaria TaxID=6604 RepID=UPI0022DF1B5F|nr:mitochondrial import receptor subunit TOM20 homolog B-like isoform X2 [Mya arenaria]
MHTSKMLTKTSLGIAAAAGAGLFLGYCIYFDRRRRNDPDFRRKLKERRKKASKQSSNTSNTKFPDPLNESACQQYFMQEINLGEILLSNGQLNEGVEHLANAVAVCGQPAHLMQVFRQTLPPEVVQSLETRIPIVKQRLLQERAEVTKKPELSAQLAEDDVE